MLPELADGIMARVFEYGHEGYISGTVHLVPDGVDKALCGRREVATDWNSRVWVTPERPHSVCGRCSRLLARYHQPEPDPELAARVAHYTEELFG